MMRKLSRRCWIQSMCGGLGAAGLAGMLARDQAWAGSRTLGPHFAPKAKSVIVLFLTGGPSQIDLFDPKPALQKYSGQRPSSVDLRTERATGGLMPSPFQFRKHGQSGIEVSELLPQLATLVDDIAVIRSMYTFLPTHLPARQIFHRGTILPSRPTLGSWLTYGLGTENENLPGFVALSPGAVPLNGPTSGFLPAEYQGTTFDNSEIEPEKMIRYLRNADLDPQAQRRQLDGIRAMNRLHADSFGADDFLEARIRAMETAYRMQFTAMDVFDVSKEPESVRAEYGTTAYARGCLMARRLVESGVRYVHLYDGPGQKWDDHAGINEKLRKRCPENDQASAALLRDLKRRGLLDDTLVVWTGEFGRTPVSESGDGRDHNPYGFTTWMAGGGIKGGTVYGATDEFGFRAVEKQVSMHDLHATILHLFGLDHEKLTYQYSGRDFRLTDVHGKVVRDIIA